MEKLQKNVGEIIIKAAQGIFARFGFNKTTMDEIAKASHKAKSSIYHYFKSKEEIFQTIVEKESLVLKEKIEKAVNQKDTPQKKLRAYIITRMTTLGHLANFYSALKDEYLEYYSFIEKIRKKHFEDEIKIIKTILKGGIDQNIFIIQDLELTAFTIIMALKGLEYPWAIENDSLKIKESIDKLLDLLFNGIVKQ